MAMSVDRDGIAARLRGLLGDFEQYELEDFAERLGVPEVSLRASVDTLSPHPSPEVLAAAIRLYGIDPTWLLTGKYDAQTHRSVIEGDTDPLVVVRRFLEPAPRVSQPPRDGHRFDDRR
jgi:hypothetical protein